jgi:hypothetical protein
MEQRRILLSWLGFDSDFLPEESRQSYIPNPDGPNISMHRFFFEEKFDKHIILYTQEAGSQVRKQALEAYFADDNARHSVEFRLVPMIEQSVMNLQDLQIKMTVLLLDFPNDHVDILVSTGTKMMHTVWHLIHLHYKDRTRLVHLRPKRFTGTNAPALFQIQFDETDLPVTAIASEKTLTIPPSDNGTFLPDNVQSIYALATKLAMTDRVPALILGESGVGKELLARHIVEHSVRNGKPFKAVNCAALSDELLRSDLFGHVKGAFTGADQERKGYFEVCNGGTLFLDEIGDISPAMQQSLLRVLQEGEITPLGDTVARKVDVRLIAATHRNLPVECNAGRFRWDLYYRLAVVELLLPSLVEWSREEREELWNRLVKKKGIELNKAEPLTLSKEVKDYVFRYPFPGNIREMENLIARLYVVSEGKAYIDDLPPTLKALSKSNPLNMKEMERLHITKALQFQSFNLAATAKVLGIAENTLRTKCERYEIPLRIPAV